MHFLIYFIIFILATLVLVFAVPEPVQRNAASTDFAKILFFVLSLMLLLEVTTATDTVVNFFLELSLQLTQWSTFSWSCHCS